VTVGQDTRQVVAVLAAVEETVVGGEIVEGAVHAAAMHVHCALHKPVRNDTQIK